MKQNVDAQEGARKRNAQANQEIRAGLEVRCAWDLLVAYHQDPPGLDRLLTEWITHRDGRWVLNQPTDDGIAELLCVRNMLDVEHGGEVDEPTLVRLCEALEALCGVASDEWVDQADRARKRVSEGGR